MWNESVMTQNLGWFDYVFSLWSFRQFINKWFLYKKVSRQSLLFRHTIYTRGTGFLLYVTETNRRGVGVGADVYFTTLEWVYVNNCEGHLGVLGLGQLYTVPSLSSHVFCCSLRQGQSPLYDSRCNLVSVYLRDSRTQVLRSWSTDGPKVEIESVRKEWYRNYLLWRRLYYNGH